MAFVIGDFLAHILACFFLGGKDAKQVKDVFFGGYS